MKLSEFLRCPIKVQRCAGRIYHMDVVPGDIVIFEPGDLFPGDIRLLSSKHLVVRYSNRKQFACQLTKCHLVISLTS
jgi:P-type Mg2+ transporter